MSILRRNALVGSIVWFFAVVIFLGLFFTSESPDVFMRDKPRKLLSVIPIAIGYLVHFYILWSTNQRKKQNKVVYDERDDNTQKVANSISFNLTLLYVFFFSIILYEKYYDFGSVPVAFMWILAYSTLAITFFMSSTIILITDLRNS